MTSCTGSVRGGFRGIWKKSVSWVESCGPKEEGWLSLARRSQASGLVAGATSVGWVGGGRWKSQHRKIVPLLLMSKKPLNSKVIKTFVPELRIRQVFFVFLDSYVLCIYVMNILCAFHTYPYLAMVQSPWWHYMGCFRTQIRIPCQILVHLRLLLRRNEKCLKNLFWRHGNHFEGVLIEW